MLVHLFPKYFEILFLSTVCGSVRTRWPPKRSNLRFGLIFLVLKLASRNFRDFVRYFYWLQCIFQILRFFAFGQKTQISYIWRNFKKPKNSFYRPLKHLISNIFTNFEIFAMNGSLLINYKRYILIWPFLPYVLVFF